MMGNECGVQKEKAFDLSHLPASFIFNIRVNSNKKNWGKKCVLHTCKERVKLIGKLLEGNVFCVGGDLSSTMKATILFVCEIGTRNLLKASTKANNSHYERDTKAAH